MLSTSHRPITPRAITHTLWRILVAAGMALATPVHAQESRGTVVVRVTSPEGPVEDAQVRSTGSMSRTNERGETTLSLPAGEHPLAVRKA
ncbi:MAG: hypothetical protein M3P24_00325, partial [Gemmatimonadota bacterium]|nr:hypothetical protein [Gemmatimonadota bacterium]